MSHSAPPICLLDDDSSFLKSVSRLLASDRLPALAFQHAVDLLAHAREHPVRLAVLDVCMPDAHGLDVQAQLRGISPEIQVILMSGLDDSRVRETALQRGALAFFTKPFEDEPFLALVRQALASDLPPLQS